MAYILVRSDQISKHSWDSQLFIITDSPQEFLLSFSGFLDDKKANLSANFEVSETIIYSKARAAGIKADLKKQNLRQIEITSSLKVKIADWIMESPVLLTL